MPTLTLPDLRQTNDYSCADVARRVTYEAHGERAKGRLSTPEHGAGPAQLEAAFRNDNWHCLCGRADVDFLRVMTAMGRPVICLIQWVPKKGESGEPVGHYVVVGRVAYGRVHYQCPTDGPSSLPINDFVGRWHDAGRCGCAFERWAIAAWPG